VIDEAEIKQLVIRLARPRASGGHAVERAALLSCGSDFDAIEAWILRHGGEPESAVTRTAGSGGLLGLRTDAVAQQRASARPPVRYGLPVGALA
jgi:hypothetical protein